MYNVFATKAAFLIIYRIMISASLKLTYQLLEEQPPPVILGNLLDDLKLISQWNFSLRSNISVRFFPMQQPGTNFFQIDNFILKAIKRIDRERLCRRSVKLAVSKDVCRCFGDDNNCYIVFTVLQVPYEHVMILHEIELQIIDINDNLPIFLPSVFSLYISEDARIGSLFTIPKAHDIDHIVQDVVKYKLSPRSQTFSIDSQNSSLYIQLIDKLDREFIQRYELKVLALDKSEGMRHTGILKLEILVEDINDCSPEFLDKETKNISLPESSILGQIVYVVQATDSDKGRNAVIHFSLSEDGHDDALQYFAISHINGEISIKKELDRETISRFLLIVLAKDLGSPSKTSSMTINIIITDINDNAPYIKLDPILFISENRPAHSVLTTFDVEDSDDGANAMVSCELFSTDLIAPFYLDFIFRRFSWYVYKIRTNFGFDRERKSFYNIVIHCRDGASNFLSTDAKVLVLIEDENDIEPVFINAHNLSSISLMENTLFPDPIFKFQAIDLDIKDNGKLHFSIMDNRYPHRLTINSSTGYLYAKGYFDYENMNVYSLIIRVQDSGKRPLSCSIRFIIRIINENDNAPEIINLGDNKIHIPENTTINSVIFTLKIIDRDDENNSKSSDTFLMNSENHFIIIGLRLITINSFNREARDKYHISIITRDKHRHDLSNIYFVDVIIEDINDCVPEFVFPSKDSGPLEISRDANPGFTIAQISARDADFGHNGKLTYELYNYNTFFNLDPSSGYLTVGEHFANIKTYQVLLNISATDQGYPPLSSFTIVIVNISKTPLLKSKSNKFDIFLQKSPIIVTFVLCICIILLMSVGIVCIVKRITQTRSRGPNLNIWRSSKWKLYFHFAH